MSTQPNSPAHYLRLMAHYARLVNGMTEMDHAAWAADKRYVRINGGGIRTVSLCSISPCGAVEGHPTRKTTHRLLESRHALIPDKARVRPKPEHRVQAALIEHTRRWPEQLPALFHLRDACEELRFVTDELKVGAIRADLVLAARRGKIWFPVFIELKFARHLKIVLGQLDKIADAIQRDVQAADAFVEFMRAAGTLEGVVDVSQALKILIWPSADGRARTTAFPPGVRALEFGKRSLPDHYDSPVLAFSVPAMNCAM